MKYRLTRDDGTELDVPGVLWESVLARAYRNGWRPSGTDAPWNLDARPDGRPGARPGARPGEPKGKLRERNTVVAATGERWAGSDYFSARSQYVRAEDAHELGAAVMRGGGAHRASTSDPLAARRDAGERRVAAFARAGGFVIGRAPDTSPSP